MKKQKSKTNGKNNRMRQLLALNTSQTTHRQKNRPAIYGQMYSLLKAKNKCINSRKRSNNTIKNETTFHHDNPGQTQLIKN